MIYKFDYDMSGTDILVINKNDKIMSPEDINNEMPYIFMKYNSNTDSYIPDEYPQLGWGDENWIYGDEEFHIFSNPVERIKYAFADFHDDNTVFDVIKSKFNYIKDIKVPARRCTTKYYLRNWMDKYGFTLDDFIFNNKYIVLSSGKYYHEFEHLVDLGLVNWNKIKYCSAYDEEELHGTN